MGKLKKREDWSARLNKVLLSRMEAPFRYGRHDCCYSVSACLRAMTGENINSLFGKCQGEGDAMGLLRRFKGIKGVIRKVAKEYSLETISIKRATGGDVVVVPSRDGRGTLAVVGLDGRFAYAAKRPRGWTRVPLSQAKLAVRIP